MRRTTIRAMAASLLLIATLVAAPAIACYWCKQSPDRMFGFCNPSSTRGWNSCSEYVYNDLNGTSTCALSGNSCPWYRADGGGGGGDSDCWWPDQSGGCILYY